MSCHHTCLPTSLFSNGWWEGAWQADGDGSNGGKWNEGGEKWDMGLGEVMKEEGVGSDWRNRMEG